MIARDKRALKACRNLEEDMVLYYYGELAESERRECEEHLKDCEHCRASLGEMSKLLPMTAAHDEPAQAFWGNYSREMRRKLDAVTERETWWRRIVGLVAPLPVPALAIGAVLLLALTLTLGKGLWHSSSSAPDDQALIEVLPMAEQLDFFSNMELLDNLDLLETLSGQGYGNT